MHRLKSDTFPIFVILIILTSGCKKESVISGNQLLGRWEATEIRLILEPGGVQTTEPIAAGNVYEFKPLQRFKSIGIAGIVATTCEGMFSLSSDSTLRLNSSCIGQMRPLKLVEITSNYFIIQNQPSPLDPQVISRMKFTKR